MGKQYKATIITPFHNTDMSLFQTTYNSVKGQTIGFENIEWIIVLHNCEKEYIDAVNDLVGGHDNVVLKELYNDARSASSPRNYALQFVTSPYLEFLDSDDYINPKTIEKCLETMEKHHPDLVIFRMAYVKENDSVHSLITDVTLWNPFEKEIILTGDGLRCKELYASINLTSHPRFFNMEFLRSNHLSFDEKITMAEDGYFMVCAYSKAEKIVVLPQFIGHYYYVNNKSAVQSVEKMTPEAILHFSYGFKKIFDRLLEMHAYHNYIFLEFLAAYIQNACSSPSFTDHDWEVLQKDMAPYAKMVTPPPVNKLFSKEAGMMIYEFVVSNILKPHKNSDMRYQNGERALALALSTNKDTDIGHYYHFEELKTIEDFRNRVPVYTHHDYDFLVNLCTEVGEKDLLTSSPVREYAYDFDESDTQRTVPVSDQMCTRMGETFISMIRGETTFLMMESMADMKQLNDGTFNDSSLGIRVRSALRDYAMRFKGFDAVFTSPVSLIFPAEPVQEDYLNLLFALRDPDVTQIYASNTLIVQYYIEILLSRGEDLCRDIEEGTICVSDDKSNRLYRELSAMLTPDPVRAQQIRTALANNKKDGLLQTIWPQMKRILAADGGKYRFYTDKIKRYAGDMKTDMDELITPFGLIGEKNSGEEAYKLNTEKNFYEFISYDTSETNRLKLLTEVESGKVYELLVTNGDGIYRMHTNIFLRPVMNSASDGLWFKECVRPLYGEGNLICGGDEFENALQSCIGDMLYDYFCYYDNIEKRLEILVEPEQDHLNADYSAAIEQMLMQNEDYRAARSSWLNPCRSRIIEKGLHLQWHNMRRKEFHAPADCFPPAHFIDINKVPFLQQYR